MEGRTLVRNAALAESVPAIGRTVEGAQVARLEPPCACGDWKATVEHISTTAAPWQAAHRAQVLRAMRQRHVASAECTATTAADR